MEGHCITIDSDSISKICDKQSWSKTPAGSMTSTSRKCMNGLIDLARWWCSDFSSEIELISPSENNIHWSPDLIPSEKYDTIRAKLDSGKPLALTIAVPIFKKKDNMRNERYASISKFTILLKRTNRMVGLMLYGLEDTYLYQTNQQYHRIMDLLRL